MRRSSLTAGHLICVLALWAAAGAWTPDLDPAADAGSDRDNASFVRTPAGTWPLLVDASTGAPTLLEDPRVTWTVDPSVVRRYGLGPIRKGVASFNDVPGSALAMHVRTGATSATSTPDGTNAVFLDEGCPSGGGTPVYAHTHRHPTADGTIAEVDIAICSRLDPRDPRYVTAIVRHEVGHALGLAHLHQPSENGWSPHTGRENICRFMYPRVHLCQPFGPHQKEIAALLYPDIPTLAAPSRRIWARTLAIPERGTPDTISKEPCLNMPSEPRGLQHPRRHCDRTASGPADAAWNTSKGVRRHTPKTDTTRPLAASSPPGNDAGGTTVLMDAPTTHPG